MDKTDSFILSIPSRFAYLKPAREFLRTLASSLGIPERRARELITIFDEACTNAIEHGSPKYSGDKVVIHIAVDYVKLTVEVFDNGNGELDIEKEEILSKYAPQPLVVGGESENPVPRRGRGLYLMARLADAIEVRPRGGQQGTVVRFSIQRPRPAGTEG